MKIVVTGGAGFIGSAVCRHLVANTAGHVVNVDKLTYAGNLENLDDVISHDRLRFIRGDIRDIHDVNVELRDEIEHFFQRYKDLEPSKQTETRGWGNRAEAITIVAASRKRAS